ncbi:MAG: hypothetical protein OXL95_12325 [Nitrospira sp.]|nr:hypothetical protein [Nitrospira sp.]
MQSTVSPFPASDDGPGSMVEEIKRLQSIPKTNPKLPSDDVAELKKEIVYLCRIINGHDEFLKHLLETLYQCCPDRNDQCIAELRAMIPEITEDNRTRHALNQALNKSLPFE